MDLASTDERLGYRGMLQATARAMRWTSLGTAAAALTVRVRRQRQVTRLAPVHVSAPVALAQVGRPGKCGKK